MHGLANFRFLWSLFLESEVLLFRKLSVPHVFAIMVFSENINLFCCTLTNNLWSLVIDGKLITLKPIKIFLLFKPNIPYHLHSCNPLVILSQIIPFLNSHPISPRSIFRCAFAKSALLCLSVRSSPAPDNSAPTGGIFMKFDIWVFYENLLRKSKFH